MPRNARPKSSASRKVTKRRDSDTSTSSSSLDLSDDGGYSAVEDITDSDDDDEEDVDAVEEEHIITRAVSTHRPHGSPRPDQAEVEQEDDADSEDNDDDDDELETENADADADVDDNGSWDGIVSEVDENVSSDNHATPHRAAQERHVRFANVPSSDSESTDTDDDHADFFPDLFVEQDRLDPYFRRELELDDEDASSTASESFWDYHGVYEINTTDDADVEAIFQELENSGLPHAEISDSFNLQPPAQIVPKEEIQELDGYETDGDTTEVDEDTPAPPVRRKTRRPSVVNASDDSDLELVKASRGQPRRGRFNLDSSDRKPIAVVNPITKKMMIFTPHRRRHLDLSPEQFNLSQYNLQSSPMVGSSAHIMMSAMSPMPMGFENLDDFMMNTNTAAPPEAFFPRLTEADESSDLPDIDEDDLQNALDFDDFLELGPGPSSDPADLDDWCRSDAIHSTPTTGSHINASNVGAFRRDQINQRLILSEKATQDSLAFSSPYNYTALRGIKSDRFETAAVPLTPMRRQKRSMQDFSRSPLEAASQKRKASGEHANGHKRHRSISDVNQLQI